MSQVREIKLLSTLWNKICSIKNQDICSITAISIFEPRCPFINQPEQEKKPATYFILSLSELVSFITVSNPAI